MEYVIMVKFTRNLADDAAVLRRKLPTDKQLIQQFRKELQDAYDAHGIAGRFEILKIER